MAIQKKKKKKLNIPKELRIRERFTQSMNVIRNSLQNRNFRKQLDTNRELK